MYKVGDKIRLKDYYIYIDYSSHANEIATINEVYDDNLYPGFRYRIRWSDGMESNICENNIKKLNKEWDDETN